MIGPNERDEIAALLAGHHEDHAWIDACICEVSIPDDDPEGRFACHLADLILASDWLVERDRRTAATAVRAMGAKFRIEARETWGGDVPWHTTGSRVATLAASWCDNEADRIEADQ